jgi:acyl carrier protein
MLPPVFVFLESFPLTSSGKTNRRALPAPEPVRPALTAAYIEPRTPVEAKLVGIWAEVLGLDRVGANDNFFELGGHSLLAIRVVSRLRESFQVEIPLRRLFETPTVAGLAQYLEAIQWSVQANPVSLGSERDEGII